jgi:hypothetical protein
VRAIMGSLCSAHVRVVLWSEQPGSSLDQSRCKSQLRKLKAHEASKSTEAGEGERSELNKRAKEEEEHTTTTGVYGGTKQPAAGHTR